MHRRYIPGKMGSRLLILFGFVLVIGCSEEKVSVIPKVDHVTLQAHNFNETKTGLLVDGSAPDMYYFRQNWNDGTYTVMLTSVWSQIDGQPYDDVFNTNWDIEYVVLQLDANGAITKNDTYKFPLIDPIVFVQYPANFHTVSKLNSSNYFGRSEPLINYYFPTFEFDKWNQITYPKSDYCCRFNVVMLDLSNGGSYNFNPHQDASDYYEPMGLFRTTDGEGTIVISRKNQFSPYEYFINYAKVADNGNIIYEHDLFYPIDPIISYQLYYSYLITERNGDYFFFNHHNNDLEGSGQWTYNNTATFLAYPEISSFDHRGFDFEIRFGSGKSQKAHRFDSNGQYQDFVNVPFEVWDVSNNRQLTISFQDKLDDGDFQLSADPNEADFFMVHDLNYSTSPYSPIMTSPMFSVDFFYYVQFALVDDFPSSSPFPSATIRVNFPPPNKPGGKLVKLNEQGVSVVNDNLLSPSSPIKNIYKIVPHGEGFAVLCNAPTPTPYQPAQLFLLDENFNQTAVLNLSDIAPDRDQRLESNGEIVYYSSILALPGESKLALRVSKIEKGSRTDRILTEFSSFKIESYQITPTNSGGLALLAWVRPDNNTRDLLFIELDANLNLVKK